MKKLSRQEIAAKVAADIPAGAVVNLGIGMPTLVGEYLDPAKEILCTAKTALLVWGLLRRKVKKTPI